MSRFWWVLVLASMLVFEAHPFGPVSGARPKRIVNSKYGFSVVFPKTWYVYEGADLPVFFNYRPEDSAPQGQLPPHGASIALIRCRHSPEVQGTTDLSSCADREVRAHFGVNVRKANISGPVSGALAALQVSYDEPALSPDRYSSHFVSVFWASGTTILGAELEYIKGDPDGQRYKETLLQVVRSFKPL
jgi:hypothetical protein